jgi:hypothetical protein
MEGDYSDPRDDITAWLAVIERLSPFEQRQLHGTATIRPELKIANQKVTPK